MKNRIAESELILNTDGSVYHLHLKNEDIADTVILVGDPDRVKLFSEFFNNIEFEKQNREIASCTGTYNNKRVTVISTGMGTDNLDIVINELDAAVNINPENREIKDNRRVLNIIRVGTSGGLHESLIAGTFVASEYAVGLDGLMYFYKNSEKIFEKNLIEEFVNFTNWDKTLPKAYAIKSSDNLLKKFAHDLNKGITLTAPGFYAPQGRQLRLELAFPEFNKKVEKFSYKNSPIANFEMESSALYGLGQLLGHNTLTICTIIANRVNKTFSQDYKKDVLELIKLVLDRV